MHDWFLFVGFILLSALALGFMIFPFRTLRSRRFFGLSYGIAGCLMLSLALLVYRHWGAWHDWHQHLQHQKQQQRVAQLLKSIKNPQQLIEQLKGRLKKTPQSAKGWYLLGRLYASTGQWTLAKAAYDRAYRLKPGDEQIIVNLAQSMWQLREQHFDAPIRQLFQQVLAHHPDQPDALAMLAMDAYQQGHRQEAIQYWQRLLKLLSPDSEEAALIRQAIAKAQS